jgi:hypothetical protein
MKFNYFQEVFGKKNFLNPEPQLFFSFPAEPVNLAFKIV